MRSFKVICWLPAVVLVCLPLAAQPLEQPGFAEKITELLDQGDYSLALTTILEALAKNPEDQTARDALTAAFETCVMREQTAVLEESFRDWTEREPQNPLARCWLGAALAAQPDREDEAEEEYQRALELDPQCTDAHFRWAALRQLQGQEEEAQTGWQKFLELEPDSERAGRVRQGWVILRWEKRTQIPGGLSCWSPDGQQLVLGWKKLYLLRRNPRPLVTPLPLSAEHEYVTPDWSPDGRFLALREDQRTVTLWEWQADGTLRATGRWPDFGLSPKFSPDGQRLLVSAVPNLSTVILDLETGEEFIVRWQHETFGGRNHNTWTADGQQVVFHGIARRELGLEERPLFRMPLGPWEDQEQRRAEGRPVGQPEQAIQLTDNQAQNWLPAVSPDNRSLAFMCDQGGTWGIYVTTLEGQPTVRLTDGRNPAWSPDGRFLTFESLTDSRLWQITLGGLDTCPLRVEAKPQEGGLLVSLTNRSDEPQSVNVTYRLFDGNSFQVAEGQVGQPDQTLQPEEVIECPLTLEGATKPGTYTVKITAVTKKGERVVELVDYEKP